MIKPILYNFANFDITSNFSGCRFNHGGTHLIGTIHEKLKDAVNFEEGSVVSVSKSGNHDEVILTPNSQIKSLEEKDWPASQVKIVHEKLVLSIFAKY